MIVPFLVPVDPTEFELKCKARSDWKRNFGALLGLEKYRFVRKLDFGFPWYMDEEWGVAHKRKDDDSPFKNVVTIVSH